MNESFFVPKILLRGDKSEFLARIGNRPFKMIGQINFVGDDFNFLNDGKFSVDEKTYGVAELKNLMNIEVDYIVFNDSQEFSKFKFVLAKIIGAKSQIVSLSEFLSLPYDAFGDLESDAQLMQWLKMMSVKNLLDINAHFAKSDLLTKFENDTTEIDCISEEKLLPVKENIYTHVYKKISDCHFKHYDAALVYGKSGIDFIAEFSAVENITDLVITFAKFNSEIEKYIVANSKFFEKIDVLKSFAGHWFLVHRHKTPEKFTIYVVTHKKLPQDHVEKLPSGYKIIHAGKVLSQDFGYLGDNTGGVEISVT